MADEKEKKEKKKGGEEEEGKQEAAPKPAGSSKMLIIAGAVLLLSDGDDWTKNTPQVEYPHIRAIYRLFGAADRVANTHFAKEKHDYGPSKRAAACAFLSWHLGLDAGSVLRSDGTLDESAVTILPQADLTVFDAAHPRPAPAVAGDDAVMKLLE